MSRNLLAPRTSRILAAVANPGQYGGAGAGVQPVLAVFGGEPVLDFDYVSLLFAPTVNDQQLHAQWYCLSPLDPRSVSDPYRSNLLLQGERTWDVAANTTLLDCVPNLGDYLDLYVLASDGAALNRLVVRLTNRAEDRIGAPGFGGVGLPNGLLAASPPLGTNVAAFTIVDVILPAYSGHAHFWWNTQFVGQGLTINTRAFNVTANNANILAGARVSGNGPTEGRIEVLLPSQINFVRLDNSAGAGLATFWYAVVADLHADH